MGSFWRQNGVFWRQNSGFCRLNGGLLLSDSQNLTSLWDGGIQNGSIFGAKMGHFWGPFWRRSLADMAVWAHFSGQNGLQKWGQKMGQKSQMLSFSLHLKMAHFWPIFGAQISPKAKFGRSGSLFGGGRFQNGSQNDQFGAHFGAAGWPAWPFGLNFGPKWGLKIGSKWSQNGPFEGPILGGAGGPNRAGIGGPGRRRSKNGVKNGSSRGFLLRVIGISRGAPAAIFFFKKKIEIEEYNIREEVSSIFGRALLNFRARLVARGSKMGHFLGSRRTQF